MIKCYFIVTKALLFVTTVLQCNACKLFKKALFFKVFASFGTFLVPVLRQNSAESDEQVSLDTCQYLRYPKLNYTILCIQNVYILYPSCIHSVSKMYT